MPKPKLSDAVHSNNTSSKPKSDTAAESPESAKDPGGDGNASDAPESSSDSDDDEPESSSGDDPEPAAGNQQPVAGKPDSDNSPSAGEKTLADFRSAFGHEQGSVFFADQTPFVDACVAHIGAQSEQLEALQKENQQLRATAAQLGKQVHGEADPVETNGGDDVVQQQADGLSAYAAGLKLPGE